MNKIIWEQDVQAGAWTPLKLVDLNETIEGHAAFAREIVAMPTASEVHLGQVGGHTPSVDATPVLTVHANYVAGDYVGTSGVAIIFANAARVAGGTGVVFGALLIDFALQSQAGELWLFDQAPTPPVDSAAWSISDADAAKCIGVIPFSTYYASALNAVSPVGNLTIGFKCAAGSRDIYGCFVTRGTPAYADGDITFRLRISQD
jgi:hypothetical protein